jgi:hypothetical protein
VCPSQEGITAIHAAPTVTPFLCSTEDDLSPEQIIDQALPTVRKPCWRPYITHVLTDRYVVVQSEQLQIDSVSNDEVASRSAASVLGKLREELVGCFDSDPDRDYPTVIMRITTLLKGHDSISDARCVACSSVFGAV